MLKTITTYPVRMTAISWGLAISSGYLIGKTIAPMVGRILFHIPEAGLWEVESVGIAIGVAVGSMVSGFLTTFMLKSKFQVQKIHLVVGTLGWFIAMLLGILMFSYVVPLFGD